MAKAQGKQGAKAAAKKKLVYKKYFPLIVIRIIF